MSPERIRLVFLSAALAAAATAGLCPPASGQTAKEAKQAAASGQQSQGGNVPLRAMVVISDAVRGYHASIFISRVDVGRRLANEAEQIFGQTFSATKTVAAVPTDPHAFDGFDLVILLDVPRCEIHSALFSNPMTLNEGFVVRNAKGQEIMRVQETANDNAKNLLNGADRLGQAVTRRFIQELLMNASVRNMLSPPAPVEVKPVLADTSIMDSSGLEVPPPPPWARPPASSPAAPGSADTGRP